MRFVGEWCLTVPLFFVCVSKFGSRIRHRYFDKTEFSFSIADAGTTAVLSTLAETTKTNGAYHYYYMKYLLGALPKVKIVKVKASLENAMPWSEAYRT